MSSEKSFVEEFTHFFSTYKSSMIHTYHIKPEVQSTNTTAKQLAHEGVPEGILVLAERQLTGRGRFNRRCH